MWEGPGGAHGSDPHRPALATSSLCSVLSFVAAPAKPRTLPTGWPFCPFTCSAAAATSTGHLWPVETRHKLLRVLTLWSHIQKSTFTSPGNDFDNTSEMFSSRKVPQRLCSRILLEPGHIDPLCLAHSKIPDPQEENRCSAQATLFTPIGQAHCATLSIYVSLGNCLSFRFQLALARTPVLGCYVNSFLHRY